MFESGLLLPTVRAQSSKRGLNGVSSPFFEMWPWGTKGRRQCFGSGIGRMCTKCQSAKTPAGGVLAASRAANMASTRAISAWTAAASPQFGVITAPRKGEKQHYLSRRNTRPMSHLLEFLHTCPQHPFGSIGTVLWCLGAVFCKSETKSRLRVFSPSFA